MPLHDADDASDSEGRAEAGSFEAVPGAGVCVHLVAVAVILVAGVAALAAVDGNGSDQCSP